VLASSRRYEFFSRFFRIARNGISPDLLLAIIVGEDQGSIASRTICNCQPFGCGWNAGNTARVFALAIDLPHPAAIVVGHEQNPWPIRAPGGPFHIPEVSHRARLPAGREVGREP